MMSLEEIRKNLLTQDNRIAADPMFVVERRVRDWGMDPDYAEAYAWVDAEDDHAEAGENEADALDAKDARGEPTAPWTRAWYRDRWEFVTACFTEAGAQACIDAHGHNLGEARIYIHSWWRNDEWITVRAALLSYESVCGARVIEEFEHAIAERDATIRQQACQVAILGQCVVCGLLDHQDGVRRDDQFFCTGCEGKPAVLGGHDHTRERR